MPSRASLCACACVLVFACSSDDKKGEPQEDATCPGDPQAFRFPSGGAGHVDPFGAAAAKQARAGRIRDASQIQQSDIAKHKVRVGDYVLANDKIALYIEAENRPNGYSPFGGEILAFEPVGEDGRPKGLSQYGETLITLSRQTIKPDKVSVLADGSDGKAAIVRVSGVLTNIPFMDTFRVIAKEEYGFPAAIDYVLEPRAEKVTVRISVQNTSPDPVDFSPRQFLGFFQSNRHKLFTRDAGYGPPPQGDQPWVAWDGGDVGFVVRSLLAPVTPDLEVSGFQLVTTKGMSVEQCGQKTVDYLELVTGGPGIDGLLEAKRRAFDEPAWREIHGIVKEANGGPLAGAYVHALSQDGSAYLTRVRASDTGQFVIHVPPEATLLVPSLQGWALPQPTALASDVTAIDLELPQHATINVEIKEAGSNADLPARVQVLPTAPPEPAPASFGLHEEVNGRIWQDFATAGRSTLPVPPGEHRVIVTRGYEYELHDEKVTVLAGTSATVKASLQRSVDSNGVMCADFHIHSYYSADAADPVEQKVRAAVADGLEIPVSSEHEWIVDFQPIIQRLDLARWAFGLPSEELTTFTWGHFGVVPITPRPDEPNNGAVDWIGKKPAEFFHQVNELPEKPVLIVNHPTGTGFFGYFSATLFDRAKAAGDPSSWSDDFGAIEVFTDTDLDTSRDRSLADWFALLNTGKTYWAVGSSDTHDQRRVYAGYPRTCLRFGHDDPTKLTAEVVRDVLRSGAATISGGLTMTAEGPGGIGPGGTSQAGAYTVVVQAPSWISATTLEVFIDGVSTQTLPLVAKGAVAPGKRFEATIDVSAPQNTGKRHYVVFHAKGDGDLSPLHPERKPFAMSNPIFF